MYPPRPSTAVPAILRLHLLSYAQNCVTSWGSLTFIFVITVILPVHRRGWTAFYSPIPSVTLGSPPPRGPGLTEALDGCEHYKRSNTFAVVSYHIILSCYFAHLVWVARTCFLHSCYIGGRCFFLSSSFFSLFLQLDFLKNRL